MLAEILQRAHARVTLAASAPEAMDLLTHHRPAVLVSDIGMPDEDGSTLMRKVRALPDDHGGRTPAIALTAYARAVDRQQAMIAGYNIHMGKAVDGRAGRRGRQPGRPRRRHLTPGPASSDPAGRGWQRGKPAILPGVPGVTSRNSCARMR